MKKTALISLILVISLLLCTPVAVSAEGIEDPVAGGSHSLHAAVPLAGSQQLLDTAQAAIAYELNTDTLLYTWNADTRINPTGLVKILTALIVLEQGNLDDMVTVYRSTLDTIAWGAVSAGLKAGEVVPLRDLLLCVMVASANDAAAVMAAHVAGNQKEFVKLMNAKALELGCTDSNFTNVHGLYDAEQYSTARDLAIIAEAALENETFTEMFALDNFSMAATNLSGSRYFITTNYMMSDEYQNQYFDYRVTGGKPAAAASTDRSMICTAQLGNSRYLLVVMSAQSEVNGNEVTKFGNFVETKKLMNFAFNGYTVRQVLDQDQALYQYPVHQGRNHVVLCPDRDVFVLLPADYEKNDIQYLPQVEEAAMQAPISAGGRLGQIRITYGGLVLADCDLVAMNAVSVDGSIVEQSSRVPVPDQNKGDWLEKIPPWVLPCVILTLVLAGIIYLTVKICVYLKTRRRQKIRARKKKSARKRSR